jgi:competence protein ComEC
MFPPTQSWARAAISLELTDKKETQARCDKKGCVVTAHGHGVAALKDESSVAEECTLSDLVVVSEPAQHINCPATLLDKTALEKWGATTVWFDGGKLKMRHVREEEGNRPWVTRAEDEE